MEWTHLVPLFFPIVHLLLSLYSGYGNKLYEFSSTSKTVISILRCVQDFSKKEALCRKRNLELVPSYLNEGTLSLDLSYNEISTLFNESFSKYPLLEQLYLFNNDIKCIETAAFYPLKHLNTLRLKNNRHLYMPNSDIFRWSERLWILGLAGCSLSYFPNDTLRWLPRLGYLDLASNRLSSINLTYCPSGENMVTVSLNNNTIYSITNETFRFTCKCQKLLLNDNVFKLVDPHMFSTVQILHLEIGFSDCLHAVPIQAYEDLFKGIAQSSIESITLSFPSYGEFHTPLTLFDPLSSKNLSNVAIYGKSIYNLYPYMFSNVTRLTRLVISSTSLVDINPGYFDGMSGLRVLDLHSNKISKFNRAFSRWNLNINLLNLSHNLIFVLSGRMFTGLKYLLELDLSDNERLTFQRLPLYSPLSNLRYLDVSRTGFYIMGNFSFPNLQNFSFSQKSHLGEPFFHPNSFKYSLLLEWIIADNSQVILSQLWSASLNLSIFQGLHHLRFIDLSSNDLQTLPRGLFPNLPLLLDLNLGNCKISVIESKAFGGLESLERLYLDHNAIFQLPRDIFYTMMRQLHLIYLNSNLLEYLPEDLFVNTPRLTNLTLSKNEFTTFSRNTFTQTQSTLKYIDLSENPIQCSCQIKWLVDWRKSSINIAREHLTICSFTSEAPFRGKPVFTIDLDNLCVSYMNLYCMLPLVAVGLFGIVSVVYCKRLFIKYKIFLLKLAVLGYKEIQDTRDHTDYEFDLNFIFIDDDKEWAINYLKPRVKEYLPHFNRIAFGDNGLPLGMYYLDAVLYVIEHSFKTILLLSRAATRDHEFMLKLRTALNHVTNTRTQCTLLILLEDIADEDLPHLVKLYLSEERPYIRWIKDDSAQKYFWKKLIKTIKVNLRCNDMIPPE